MYGSFAPGNFMLADLRSMRIAGRFTPEMADDTGYWNRVIFPMLISVLSGSLGLVELHCACVARDGKGVLLAGPGRSGKSTLAAALGYLGFGILSDDRVLCSVRDQQLRAWSANAHIKLRGDVLPWFPELRNHEHIREENGEASLRFSPSSSTSLRGLRVCAPRQIIFLERQSSAAFRLTRISQSQAEARLRADLMAELPAAAKRQAQIFTRLRELPCSILQYSDDPFAAAKQLAASFDAPEVSQITRTTNSDTQTLTCSPRTVKQSARSTIRTVDPLRRFLPAPHSALISAMGKPVRFETNNPEILQFVQELFKIYPHVHGDPRFLWRIVSESADTTPRQRRIAFSGQGLRFAQFGERCFYVIDTRSRIAVAYVKEPIASGEVRLAIVESLSFFCMCAPNFGFVPLFGNCAALDGRSLLLLGAPGSGKTTASYIAAKSGMILQADGGLFLELAEHKLKTWGGFWPVTFRKDAPRFFPELANLAEPFHFENLDYYRLNHRALHGPELPATSPIGCVFLRRTDEVNLNTVRLSREAAYRRVADSLLLREEGRFGRRQAAILSEVAKLPAYEITYGPDPAVAAEVIRELLLNNVQKAELPLRNQCSGELFPAQSSASALNPA